MKDDSGVGGRRRVDYIICCNHHTKMWTGLKSQKHMIGECIIWWVWPNQYIKYSEQILFVLTLIENMMVDEILWADAPKIAWVDFYHTTVLLERGVLLLRTMNGIGRHSCCVEGIHYNQTANWLIAKQSQCTTLWKDDMPRACGTAKIEVNNFLRNLSHCRQRMINSKWFSRVKPFWVSDTVLDNSTIFCDLTRHRSVCVIHSYHYFASSLSLSKTRSQ